MADPSLAIKAEAIRTQMRQVRRELGEDVEGLVDNAQVLTDWRYYVRTYPWLCVGAAAAVGFLIVPSRAQVVRPDPALMAELAKARKIVVTPNAEPPTKSTLAGSLGSLIGNALLHAGLTLVKQQLSTRVDSYIRRSQVTASNGHGKDGAP